MHSRDRSMAELRRLTQGDSFMTSYALLYAAQLLDLEQLNRLVDAAAETVTAHPPAERKKAGLVAERFGHRSRLD